MESKQEKFTHTQTEKTIKASAGYKRIGCFFFCQSIKDTDVLEPTNLKEPLLKSPEKK